MKCPACNTDNADKVKYCENCGYNLSQVCPHCGSDISNTEYFCPHCGEAVNYQPKRRVLKIKSKSTKSIMSNNSFQETEPDKPNIVRRIIIIAFIVMFTLPIIWTIIKMILFDALSLYVKALLGS